jgi:selenocysteine-specific elongation factor
MRAAALSAKQEQFLGRVVEVLNRDPVNTLSALDLARELGVPPQATTEIVRLGLASGRLVRLADGLIYSEEQLATIKEKVRVAANGEPFSTSSMKDALGTTRKFVVPLLEYFDVIGFTEREGEERRIL